jgi:hypothetical protein
MEVPQNMSMSYLPYLEKVSADRIKCLEIRIKDLEKRKSR